jgi:4-carboxymuconolactone decarboxylase
MSEDDVRAAGMAVRRRILGDAHVDRAIANTTDLTKEFQDLITRYGWGEVWTRPGLDYRTRRILVLGTMLALGHWEEFRMHLRAALAEGFSLADVKELMLQQAIYCGIPRVNTGFSHVDAVVKELTSQGVDINKG